MLGVPARRRILELLAGGERPAGELAVIVGNEFGISQPAVSQHLRVLRDHGFTSVRASGTLRLYTVEPAALDGVEAWIADLRRAWEQRLDALGTELARGQKARRSVAKTKPRRTS